MKVPEPAIADRKAEHITISTGQQVEPAISASWNDVALVHNCLPEIDLDDVDISTEFLGRTLSAPLVISSMTGGHELARAINAVLARAAETFGLAMGVGSQRAYLKDAALARTYDVVREVAPSAFIIGNVGAPQLIPQQGGEPVSMAQIRSLLELVRADALAVHLNYLQEMIQPEGDTRARGALAAIKHVVAGAGLPVIAKETGAGIAPSQAAQLRDAGVAALDVGGLGGTSFAIVEAQRARLHNSHAKANLGELFASWGIPTMAAIPMACTAGLPVIGSGGIRSGLDAAKALALGASLVGLARPLLVVAQQGVDATVEWIGRFLDELRTAMFLTGSRSPSELRGKAIVLGPTKEWLDGLAAIG